MRVLLGLVLLLLSPCALSQSASFPSQCQEMLRFPTPTNEALCKNLQPVWRSAHDQYINALGRVQTFAEWNKLWESRILFISKFYNCQIKGYVPEVTECLRSAFEDISNQLPVLDATSEQLSELTGKANKVNDSIYSLVNDRLHKCKLDRIKALDDGVSPARDIAVAVSPACKREASELARIFYAALSVALIGDIQNLGKIRERGEEFISPENVIVTVLEYRASIRDKDLQKKKNVSSRKVES
ncbi:hypothetical protein [Dechloromonas denitrificans]|uniref:hypothetical protein n=1 Tax=Dechloromonas denitrificans TaxID=281362 RepID=UPI001CF92901|nr:hypothetical protein [Dechloromonas denitrificans]UCV04474.1 hypothetical protein KI611_04190 [Dechloromonas denitrificans]